MGKARTAAEALDSEIERLEKDWAAAKRDILQADEQIATLTAKREEARVRSAELAGQVQARQFALDLLSGKAQGVAAISAETIEAQNIQTGGIPAEKIAEGEMSEETKRLVALAHEGEEEDEAEPDAVPTPTKRKGKKLGDEPEVRTLKPGQNPMDVLSRMRSEEEGTPAEA